jgi:adenylate cyclase
VYWRSWWEGWHSALAVGTSEVEVAAAHHLEQAMVEPGSLAHQITAQMRLWDGRYDDALAEADKAVALDPSDADARAVLAEVLIYVGEPAAALAAIEEARRLDPHNQARYAYLEGFARFNLEEFEAAAALLERALELGPDLWPESKSYGAAHCDPCELLLAAYGYLGGPEEKTRAIRDRLAGVSWGLHMLTVRTIVAFQPFKQPTDAGRVAEGLRLAGLPEYAP